METRLCKTCGAGKGAAEFYRGRHSCKECVRTTVRTRAKLNPAVQEYDRARASLPHGREHIRRVTKKWRAENPMGYRAQTAVSNAVRDGRLKKQPCAICGEARVHAHHKDYARPLDVIWLCAKCHHRLHAVFPELEGLNKREAPHGQEA